jgi:4-methylaminobutanoate oxidase (formaldehyde-forming)
MAAYPKRVRAVVIGGGVVGCSVAYHLTLRGASDVVLLERRKLTCGTTWHAAGLVGQLRATQNLTRLAQYSAGLYAGLEAETGQATGFRRTGSISLATTEARLEELLRGASMARSFGLEVEEISAAEAREKWPLLSADGVVGAVWLPGDGRINPVDVTLALAKGARQRGARIFEDAEVKEIVVDRGRAGGVRTANGDIEADVVVLAAGLWSRELAAKAGVNVPLHAAEHFYIVTEPIPGLGCDAPVLRDPDACAYFKEDAGKLLVGWFEPKAKPWDNPPEDFAFDALPPDLDHIEPLMEAAIRRVPALGEAGVQLFFNGPESFTPDDRYLLGETPEAQGLYVATGFNSIGVQSAGGAGKVLADWILDGHPPMDLWDVDIRRMTPFQRNRRYLRERTVEGLGLLYAMHWPFRQPESARGVRRSALHDRLNAAGACFGETAGWERANWFAPPGVMPEYAYSYGRQNWFAYSAEEHRAVREAAGLFDQSSFGKFVVEGPEAEAALDRISANDIAVPVGRVVYTQWLNERGGVEADVTVTRESETRFLVVTSASSQTRDLAWLKRHLGDFRAVAVDVTSGFATLGLMGPRVREILSQLTDADLSNAAFPFATSREIDLGFAWVRASRITYVGELGWELYVQTEFVQGVYDRLVEAGAPFGLKLAGYHALNSLRMEKAYRHWGHDITEEDTPDEAGLGFAVRLNGNRDFIGREALLRRRDQGVRRRLAQFVLEDEAPLLFHNEPVFREGKLVGRIASGMFGHTIGRAIGLGYVENGGAVVTSDWVTGGAYEIEIAGRRFVARAHLRPVYDPESLRVRS